MEPTNNPLPQTLKPSLKARILNGYEEPYRRKNNPRKGFKANRELHEGSASQEKYQFEPKSSIELKISSKSILPTLKQDKPMLYKRSRDNQKELTLDKILGSDFKPIELSQIEDFSRELFPPRPVNIISKQRRESFYSQDSEKENKSHLPQSLIYDEPDSGCYSEDLHYRRILNKPGNLHFNLSKLTRESSLDENSPQNQLSCQSSTLPSFNNEYTGYSKPKPSVLREIQAHPLKKSQFSRRVEELEETFSSGINNNRQVTPAVVIMENHEDLYSFEKSPEKPEKVLVKNSSQNHLAQIETHQHFQSQIKSDKNSPALSYKGLKPVRVSKALKENKAPPAPLSINESKLGNEDQMLLQKYGSKFGIRPQELIKVHNRSPLHHLQLNTNTLSGRSLRNSTPFIDDKKQAQSSTLQSKTRLFYQ